MIEQDEVEDFEDIIRKHGRHVEDFEILTKEPPLPKGIFKEPASPSGIFTQHHSISIRNKKTGIERIYTAGHESVWHNEFENDLKTGQFE